MAGPFRGDPFPYVKPYRGMPQRVSQDPMGPVPGAPTLGGPPRLPGLGGAVPYDPPTPPPLFVEQQAPQLGRGQDYEAVTVQRRWLDCAVPPGAQVYTSKQRWRACDVYLNLDGGAAPINGIFTVQVFAVSAFGARTLVATGRLGRFSQAGPTFTTQRPFWICAARAVAERYEVTVFFNASAGGGSSGETLTVTTVCSDEMTEPPTLVGCMLGAAVATTTGGVIAVGGASDQAPFPELCMVQASLNIAAPTWLHFHDRTVASPAGLTPHMIWGIGSAAGAGIFDESVRYRCQTNGFLLALSSTIATTTLVAGAGDGSLQCLWR